MLGTHALVLPIYELCVCKCASLLVLLHQTVVFFVFKTNSKLLKY